MLPIIRPDHDILHLSLVLSRCYNRRLIDDRESPVEQRSIMHSIRRNIWNLLVPPHEPYSTECER